MRCVCFEFMFLLETIDFCLLISACTSKSNHLCECAIRKQPRLRMDTAVMPNTQMSHAEMRVFSPFARTYRVPTN